MDADKKHLGNQREVPPRVNLLGEIDALLELLREEPGSEEAASRLNTLLTENPSLREYVATQLSDEAMLMSELQIRAAQEQFSEISRDVPQGSLLGSLAGAVQAKQPTSARSTKGVSEVATLGDRFDDHRDRSQFWWDFRNATLWASFAAMFLLGVVTTSVFMRFWVSPGGQQAENTPQFDQSESTVEDSLTPEELSPHPLTPRPSSLSYVAHVVHHTGDMWQSNSSQPLQAGSGVRNGETIRLSGGIAQLLFQDGVLVHLEGPAELKLEPNGIPVLVYGKIYVQTPWSERDFQVATPTRSLWLPSDAKVGMALYGSTLQVHAFGGDVAIGGESDESRETLVASGKAAFLDFSFSATPRVVEYRLNEDLFASRLSMGSDLLRITDAYAQSVKDSNPLAYWRFEEATNSPEGRFVKNEVSGRYACQLFGGVNLAWQANNHALEFGYGKSSGSARVNDSFDDLKGNEYTFELWVKPSHFHLGAILGLVRKGSNLGNAEVHGSLLELLGPFNARDQKHNCFRFLHRNPVGAHGGTDCYSSASYEARHWQHVVAVKTQQESRLYLNGKLDKVEQDPTSISPGLSLIIGKLYSFETMRPYVGLIDELAIYDRALSADEIGHHYELAANRSTRGDQVK